MQAPVRYHSVTPWFAVAALSLGCLGCTEVSESNTTVAVEQWTLSERPLFSIGGIDGEAPYLLSRAYRAQILSDSALLVVEGPELRIFEDDGRWRRTIGQSGSGPGDLDSPGWVMEDAGNLVVWDPELRRMTTFSPQGDVVETAPLSSRGITGLPRYIGMLPGAQHVFMGYEGFPAEIPRGSPEVYSVGQIVNTLVVESAMAVDTVLEGEGYRRYFVRVNRDDAQLGIGTVPLSSNYLTSAGSDFVVVGHGDSEHLLIINPDHQVDSVPLGFSRTEVDSDARREVRRLEVTEESGRDREVGEILLDNMQWPDSVPYIDDLFVDSSDRIWARHFSLSSETRRWSIYTRSDGRVGELFLPTSISVLDARHSRLATRRTDELGVPYLDVWRLTCPSACRSGTRSSSTPGGTAEPRPGS